MNRAERRRIQKKQSKKEPVYNISEQNLNNLKQNATENATNTAFILMLGLPIMAFHDHISDLWKKEVDGKCREERFLDYILDLYDSFEKDYITLDDVIQTIKEETGATIDFKDDRKGKFII